MELIKGGIYTSSFSTNILISESQKAYFVALIENEIDMTDYVFINQNSIIQKLKKLIPNKIHICFADKTTDYFNEQIDGYLGEIPEYLLIDLENLLVEQDWYKKWK